MALWTIHIRIIDSATCMCTRRGLRKEHCGQEALTLGCAVLASDCSGNREQLTDGVDGRFCELSPEGLASGIQELLADEALRKRLGKAAAQKTTVYTKDMDRLLELLNSDT